MTRINVLALAAASFYAGTFRGENSVANMSLCRFRFLKELPPPATEATSFFLLFKKYINKVNTTNYYPICTTYLRN